MATEYLGDLDDARLAVYRALKATNATRGLDHFVVEGEKLVTRLLASRFPMISVLATDRHEARIRPLVPADVPLLIVPFEKIQPLVGFPFHQGVLACGAREPWPDWDSMAVEPNRGLSLVVLPRLSNPENLGAIARIGDAFGIDAILAGESCPDPFSRRVLRVSMGSVLRLPVLVRADLPAIATRLAKEHAVEFLAAVADASAVSCNRVGRPPRFALVLGEEDQGIDSEWLALCQQAVTIPMRPGAGSLNVAVATGILLHNLMVDRKHAL